MACPNCGGDIRLISFITDPGPIRKILTHVGEPLETPHVSPAHIALKSVAQHSGKAAFLLPGASDTIDFPALFRQFYAGGYRGDLNCEVSGMVWGKPNYDSLEAARKCYAAMHHAMQEVNVPRV